MSLDTGLVGRRATPVTRSWTSTDAMLYALGVGAGPEELAFTTENSDGVTQLVLPTYGVLLAHTPLPDLGPVDQAGLVHAEQAFTLDGPLPVAATVVAETTVTDVYDKGSGALIITESTATVPGGRRVVSCRSAVFLRGEGGFGGDRGPRSTWLLPDRPPDRMVTYDTHPEQALLYRLNGDRNPLHSDPAFARRAGYPRPILHGLCTYGFTGRALLHGMAASDPGALRGMSGRFTAAVLPGEPLTVQMWRADDEVLFRTVDSTGRVVIDHGKALVHTPARRHAPLRTGAVGEPGSAPDHTSSDGDC